MAYTDNFPQRPVFMADFANGGKIDPRATFTRSDTPPTYAAPSAVHYWSNEKHLSSENLFVQSSDFDTTWGRAGLNVPPTGGQADPSGGTDGFTWVENTQTTFHQFYQDITASGELSLTIYAKQNSGTRYLMFRFYNGSGDWTVAVFDLAGGAPLTVNSASSTRTSVSATQTASGGGYYKCNLKATGSTTSAVIALKNTYDTSGLSSSSGGASYAGDNTSSIDVAFASLTTTGATDYQSTTTQIHREYAPTLKSVGTAGQPRFEYDPAYDGQSVAKGILIEGQATNLVTYSSNFAHSSWVKFRTNVEGDAAIAPDGTLSADYLRANADNADGMNLFSSATITNNSTVNGSFYIKKTGTDSHCVILIYNGGNQARQWFDLVNKTTTTSYSVGSGFSVVNAGVEDVGNGWMRINVSASCTGTTAYIAIYPSVSSDGSFASTVASSNALLWGAQLTESSFPSSLISTSGSAATRALESLSMTDSSLFDNGGGTLYAEASRNAVLTYNGVFSVDDGTNSNIVQMFGIGSNFRAEIKSGGTGVANMIGGAFTANTFHKHCVSFGQSEAKYYVNGSQIGSTDTDLNIPAMSQIHLGVLNTSGNHLNGHIKRVAVFSEPVSATNAAALTS